MGRQSYSRRNFLKVIGCGAMLALHKHSTACGQNAADAFKNKPNIVFILTDDQRYDAMSCAGHPWLKTPNMDRLANEGVLFKNAFVTTCLTSELYNLKTDPGELDNLFGNPEYDDITEQMKKELARLQKKTGFRYPE